MMKIYWTISSIPEIAALPKAERAKIWRSACDQAPFNWLGFLACGLCVGLGSLIGDQFQHGKLGSALAAGIGGLIFSQIAVRNAIPFILKAIEENRKI
jgi:hypothetical protein